MRLDLIDSALDDTVSGPSKVKWVKRKLLGDPRKAPKRLFGVVVFLLFLALVIGVLHLLRSTAETSGSSIWLVSIVTDIVGTLWFAIPVALWLYYKYLGRRRSRYASDAAEKTGWLTESVKQLADAVRSTDHTKRIIVTSDDDFDTIRSAVDAALKGESHPFESVDYYGRGRDGEEQEEGEVPALPEGDVTRPDEPEENVERDRTRWQQVKQIPRLAGRAVADGILTLLEGTWAAITTVGGGIVAVPLFLFGLVFDRGDRDVEDSDEAETVEESEEEIPWRVRFSEEFKHFLLDLSAGYRSDDIRWRFILPAVLTMVTLLLAFQLWVHPVAYLVFICTSALVGLGVFWASKKLRSRRINSYRQRVDGDHWEDAAGLVKTAETEDVTAYVGFMGGRTYATYDREEFVDEFSLRLWQRTHNERVSPSILEQYARNLATMKPNLSGHKENVERPAIQRRIKQVVEETEDQVVEKAELAFRVIEPVGESVKFERTLGHDPRLVAAEYKWLVEQGGVLSEMEVTMPNARGEETDLTLVYPSEKTRLPDIQQVHSRLSDRFHGLQGDPYYRLPTVNPAMHISPFQATANAWAELPDTGPNGQKTVSAGSM